MPVVETFITDNQTDEEGNKKAPPAPGIYPKAVYNAKGKSKLVKDGDEEAMLDPKEWRDSPAAFEEHADHESYMRGKKERPDAGFLVAKAAALDQREADLKAAQTEAEAALERREAEIKAAQEAIDAHRAALESKRGPGRPPKESAE